MKPLSIPGVHPANVISNATVFTVDDNIVVIYRAPRAKHWTARIYPTDGSSTGVCADTTKQIAKYAKRIGAQYRGKADQRRRIKDSLRQLIDALAP